MWASNSFCPITCSLHYRMHNPCLSLRRKYRYTAAARRVLGGGRDIDSVIGNTDAERPRPVRGGHLLQRLLRLDVNHHQLARGRRVIIMTELQVRGRTAIAAEAG